MGKIMFIGTGEAFDNGRYNSSFFIENNNETIMVDCGYNSLLSFMKMKHYIEDPKYLLLTHKHGDHMAGIPALLLAKYQEVRQFRESGDVEHAKDHVGHIHIRSPDEDLLKLIEGDVERDFPEYFEKVSKGNQKVYLSRLEGECEMAGLKVSYAESRHNVRNFAYRFDSEKYSFAISGDGGITAKAWKLYNSVDLLIHEGYSIENKINKNHSSMKDVIYMAKKNKIRNVQFVHVNKFEREKQQEIDEVFDYGMKNGVNCWLPNDYDVISF